MSVSTISKALNGAPDIGENTRKRIIEIASKHGYELSRKKANKSSEDETTIAIIYPDFVSGYFSQILDKFDERIRDRNGTMVMGCSRFDQTLEKKLLEYFSRNCSVDGVICISPFNQVDMLSSSGVPVILISQTDPVNSKVDTLKVDDRLGIYQAIARYCELGHRRIAYIGEDNTFSRLAYFKEAMIKCDCEIDNSLIKVSSNRFEMAGYDCMSELIAEGNIPTAIFAAYDDIAMGALRVLYENNLRIPEDVSIVGLDDTASVLSPKARLSTIDCHIDEQVQIALSILFKKINCSQFTAVQNITIQTELMDRETIALPRSNLQKEIKAF